MQISEVRVKMVDNPNERLQAFCSITLDGDFVVRDLKVIEGTNGAFVAMPSRKLADRCPRCSAKNHLRARFCNDCGAKLNENRAPKDNMGRAKLHADIAHPINAACRERIQQAVIEAYLQEKEASEQPDYQPKSFDDFDDFESYEELQLVETVSAGTSGTQPGKAEPESDRSSGRGRRRSRSRSRQSEKNRRQEPEGKKDEADQGDNVDEAREFVSDYNALIADLKKDAADRRDKRSRPGRGNQQESRGRRDRQSQQPRSEDRERLHSKSSPSYPGEEKGEAHEPDPAQVESPVAAQPDNDEEEDDFTAGLF